MSCVCVRVCVCELCVRQIGATFPGPTLVKAKQMRRKCQVWHAHARSWRIVSDGCVNSWQAAKTKWAQLKWFCALIWREPHKKAANLAPQEAKVNAQQQQRKQQQQQQPQEFGSRLLGCRQLSGSPMSVTLTDVKQTSQAANNQFGQRVPLGSMCQWEQQQQQQQLYSVAAAIVAFNN